jgi:hypothetical protein
MVKHQIVALVIVGSIPTILLLVYLAEMVDATDLKSVFYFKSVGSIPIVNIFLKLEQFYVNFTHLFSY